jgi:hypothetical protein
MQTIICAVVNPAKKFDAFFTNNHYSSDIESLHISLFQLKWKNEIIVQNALDMPFRIK